MNEPLSASDCHTCVIHSSGAGDRSSQSTSTPASKRAILCRRRRSRLTTRRFPCLFFSPLPPSAFSVPYAARLQQHWCSLWSFTTVLAITPHTHTHTRPARFRQSSPVSFVPSFCLASFPNPRPIQTGPRAAYPLDQSKRAVLQAWEARNQLAPCSESRYFLFSLFCNA